MSRVTVVLVFLLLIAIPLVLLVREFGSARDSAPALKISRFSYRGWTNSWRMGNGLAEVVVVPTIGRVMQFRLAGQQGPFWENPAFYGKAPDPGSPDWGNFGGDKTWPSPQSDWQAWTPRAWPPPPAFDSMAVEARREGNHLLLTSPPDPYYGIRTEREVHLDPERPQMTLITRYEKVESPSREGHDLSARRLGIWIITQLEAPLAVFIPVPSRGLFSDGYYKQSEDVPPSLQRSNAWLRLTRDPTKSYKLGNDAEALIWVGEKVVLKIDSPRSQSGEYPDHGCSAEVYTNPDPLAYVELEILGPLRELRLGDTMSQTNTYTLYPRREVTPDAEAERILGREP